MNRTEHGFTLVELLVVIAIIAILVGILIPVVGNALKRAEITRAQTEMAGIASAIRAYYAEYGLMPVYNNGNRDHTYVGKWGTVGGNPKPTSIIFGILRGLNRTNNPKGIVFLEIPEKSMEGVSTLRGSAETYTASDGFYLDPWGNPYAIVVDTEGDGQIGGFKTFVGSGIGFSQIDSMLDQQSPTGSGTFPGTTVGVMSWGPEPGQTNSFLRSW